MKSSKIVSFCAVSAIGLALWLIGCSLPDRKVSPRPAASGAGVHGTVVVRLSAKTAAGDSAKLSASSAGRTLALPDIKLQLRNTATGDVVSKQTDLLGHYEFPVVKPGRYVLEWLAQRGWAAGQLPDPIVIDRHTIYPLAIELDPDKGNRLVAGVVKLADGGSPWFEEPLAGLQRTAKVDLAGGGVTAVRANFAGEFAIAESPAGEIKLRATSQGAAGQRVLAAAAVAPYVEITLANHRPRVDAIVARQGGKVVTTAAAGSIVSAEVLVEDADGDALEIVWRDTAGAVVGNGPSVSWTLPGLPGVYSLYTTISDRKGGDRSGRLSIVVGAKSANMTGTIVDQNRRPVSGAAIALNGKTATSDGNGFFSVEAPIADRYVFNVTQTGFAAFSRLFDHPVNGHRWQLVPTQIVSIDPTKAVEIVDRRPSLEKKQRRGAVLRLPPGALVDSYGNPAVGPVQAAFATLDIAEDEAPGDYAAVDTSGNGVGLISYGMAFAEFTDGAGRPVNLKSGVAAELEVPIPTSMTRGAPAEIDTWYYDTVDGFWKPMGRATLDAATGLYRAKVSHFSTINMDQPGPVSCLRVHSDSSIPTGLILRVSDVPGVGIDFAQVKEVVMDGALNGIYRIPANTQVKLEVFDASHNLLSNVILEDGNTTGAIGVALAGNIVQSGPANADLWPPSPFVGCKPVTLKLNSLWSGYPASPFLRRAFNDDIGSDADATAYYAFVAPGGDPSYDRSTLETWWATNHFSATGGDPGLAGYTYARTSYLNDNDLGSGRDMHFLKGPGGVLAAYVTNYSRGGPFDQNPVFADDAAGHFQPGATVCMEFSPIEGQADTTKVVKFFVYAEADGAAGTERQKAADLDGFGAKFVPALCINCHGGNFDPAAISVAGLTGSSRSQFRELDLATYKFPGGRTVANAAEQDAFRAQNLMLVETAATRGPIIDLVNGWYPGGVGDQNNAGYTPTAWVGAPQETLYHEVTAVSCRTCHIAFDSADTAGGLDWNRYDQFSARRSRFNDVVIGDTLSLPTSRYMPHALVTYRQFWLQRGPHRPERLWLYLHAPEWTPAIGAPTP